MPAAIVLAVQRTLLEFEACTAASVQPLPTFAGDAWRSALGPALRAAACRTGAPDCNGCAWQQSCDWSYLFDTPTPSDAKRMRLYQQVPHPYTLRELPSDTASGARLMLTLVGRAAALRGLVVDALARAAQSTQGIDGRRLRLVATLGESALGSSDWMPIGGPPPAVCTQFVPPLPAARTLRIELTTPMRVKREGRTVAAGAFRFADLFSPLMRRVSNLCHMHGGQPLDIDFAGLTRRAVGIEARCELRPARQQRYSQRQRQSIPMDGVLGTLDVASADVAPMWPLLWLGQYVHAGSGATMGLGHYELREPSHACESEHSQACDLEHSQACESETSQACESDSIVRRAPMMPA